MLRHLTKNPFLPRRCLLLQPHRPCANATSSAAAGEIAPDPAAPEVPLEDGLAEESRSRLVRSTCGLLELRDSWSPKLEAQLRSLLRVLSPPQVRAVLRVQAQRDARAAFEFFRWADRQWKYRHAPEVFDEMLALLSRTRLHDPARRVVRLMIRRGIRRGPQQFAHLMLSYSRAGKLRSAMRVLQLMQKDGCAPDLSICNVAVNVLVVAGRVDKALEFAERMRRVGVDPDVVTYNCLIKGLCESRRIVDALEMIGSMLQNGCPPDKVSYFTVMSFLCKEKRVAEVRNLLERMRNDAGLFPDQVTYNMLIHALAKHGHADEALGFLRESEGKRFRVDVVGYSAVVHSLCLNGRMAEAKEIVSEMISKGCDPDVVTYSAVVDGFCRIGEPDQARKMMKHMYKAGCKPNTVTHTALLNGLCKVGKSSEAWELLNKSEEEWWTPNGITYSVVMHGFRSEGKLKESCDVVAQMLQKGFFPTTAEINLLIHALCKEGKPADAKDFMEQCQSKGCSINVVNFTTVIHGFSRQGDLESALSLLDDMYLTNRHPDVVTYTVVVDALGKKGKMKEATELVGKMLNRGLLPTPVTYRTVIHRYCEKGKVEELLNLLDKMLARQQFSSAYNQVIEKLCAFGKPSEAYNLLSKVLRTASKRDAQTCHILMESFLNMGLALQSYNVACRMFQRNLVPDLKLCQKVESQLAQMGERQASGKLITKFVERGVLLCGCGLKKDGLQPVGPARLDLAIAERRHTPDQALGMLRASPRRCRWRTLRLRLPTLAPCRPPHQCWWPSNRCRSFSHGQVRKWRTAKRSPAGLRNFASGRCDREIYAMRLLYHSDPSSGVWFGDPSLCLSWTVELQIQWTLYCLVPCAETCAEGPCQEHSMYNRMSLAGDGNDKDIVYIRKRWRVGWKPNFIGI